jgi:hypothetical protein
MEFRAQRLKVQLLRDRRPFKTGPLLLGAGRLDGWADWDTPFPQRLPRSTNPGGAVDPAEKQAAEGLQSNIAWKENPSGACLMRVFLSWSGDASKAIARCLNHWLPRVLQAVEPWFSEDDIAPGSRWLQELLTNLKSQDFFIACVTAESLNSAWFVFEVGVAASKLLSDEGRRRVCPILWKLENTDVPQPLAMFQTLGVAESDIFKLVSEINGKLERSLSESDLVAAFQKWWPELCECLKVVPEQDGVPQVRKQEDILEELLATMRQESVNSGITILTLNRIQEELNSLSMRLPAPAPWSTFGSSTLATPAISPGYLQLLLQGQQRQPKESTENKAGIGIAPKVRDAVSEKPDIGKPPIIE